MTYDTEELYEMALATSKEKKARSIEDLVSYMPCDKTTFYKHFPVKSNEFNTIKKEIDQNKVEIKERLVSMWTSLTHTSPATQIFLYKLCANKEEREAIYDTSIKATVEAPKHNITLNLKKSDEKNDHIIDVEMEKSKEEAKND